MNMKWDADKYADKFSFVYQYGNSVLELLEIDKDMVILDLGCGTGTLTKKLSEMCAKAVGIDASEDLLEAAKKHYPELEFIHADATNFVLNEKVDAIFSNAVFHWIEQEKQPELLHCIYSALKENGQLVFEFGGYGNNRLIHLALESVFENHHREYNMPFYFPTIGQYASLLEQSGLKVRSMSLFDRMTALNGQNGLEDWIKMFVKKPFEGVPEDEKNTIITQAVDILEKDLFHNGVWYADYVRIRGKAIKA